MTYEMMGRGKREMESQANQGITIFGAEGRRQDLPRCPDTVGLVVLILTAHKNYPGALKILLSRPHSRKPGVFGLGTGASISSF